MLSGKPVLQMVVDCWTASQRASKEKPNDQLPQAILVSVLPSPRHLNFPEDLSVSSCCSCCRVCALSHGIHLCRFLFQNCGDGLSGVGP